MDQALVSWGITCLLASLLAVQWRRFTRLRLEKEEQALECARLNERNQERGRLEHELMLLRKECDVLKKREGQLEAQCIDAEQGVAEKMALMTQTKEELTRVFTTLSSEALTKSNQAFLQLAEERFARLQGQAKDDLAKKQQAIEALVHPLHHSLHALDRGMKEWEKERKGDQEELKAKLQAMIEAEKELKDEASMLARALRAPILRGRWGELQLRRVVELADMVDHCDFYEQKGVDGGALRPDLVVHLPGRKQVVIDAKTPSEAYLAGLQADTEKAREVHGRAHAKHLRQHVLALGKKGYWRQFAETPEFVVMFIPSDNFFSAALQFEPSLIEIGVEQGVVIATPTTLIGLLRAIAYGWKQDKLSRHADEVRQLGRELYQRLASMGKHWSAVGRSLEGAVEAYNRAVGSFESRVFVTARKFSQLGATQSSLEIDKPEPIDRVPRTVKAIEATD